MLLTMRLWPQEKSGYSSDEGGMGSTYRVPGPPPAPIFSSVAAVPATAAADGSEEERLVESICSRGGLRAQPDREALRLFVESLANLSGAKVAQQLQHKIVSPLHPPFLPLLKLLPCCWLSCGQCAISSKRWRCCKLAVVSAPMSILCPSRLSHSGPF